MTASICAMMHSEEEFESREHNVLLSATGEFRLIAAEKETLKLNLAQIFGPMERQRYPRTVASWH